MSDTKEIKEYKKIVSKMILKVYNDQQKKINKLYITMNCLNSDIYRFVSQ